MYLHLGRGNVVRIEDILAITDFERLTSFKKGQDYIDSFIEREDIENPKDQLFPQSCVFVLKGIDEDIPEEKSEQELLRDFVFPADLRDFTVAERATLEFKRKRSEKIKAEIKRKAEEYNLEKYKNDDKFKEGGEFYIPGDEDFEDINNNRNYERIVGKISKEEEDEVNLICDTLFPNMRYRYNFTEYYKSDETDISYFDSKFFNGASKEKIASILPEYNLYEKCRMVTAFRVHTRNEIGENALKDIEEREDISYILGFGKLYLYGKKIYYPENTRLYIYVSEYTPLTLYKRIKEEENLYYYAGKED